MKKYLQIIGLVICSLIFPKDVFADVAAGTQFMHDGFTYEVRQCNSTTGSYVVDVVRCSKTGDIVINATVDTNRENSTHINGNPFDETHSWTVSHIYCIFDNSDAVKSLTVENGPWSINLSMFRAVNNLKSVKLPASISHIDPSEYTDTFNNLESFVIDSENPWYMCNDMVIYSKQPNTDPAKPNHLVYYIKSKSGNQFTIPEDVKYVNYLSFPSDCKLEEVTLGKNVTNVHAGTFGSSMKKINVVDENPYFLDIDGILFSKRAEGAEIKHDSLIMCPPKLIFNDRVENSEYGKYEIPDGVKVVKIGAFSNQADLQEIKFPNTIEKIMGGSFAQDSHLKYVELPQSGVIEDNAFLVCSNIETVNIGLREDFNSAMFTRCGNINTIEVATGNPKYESLAGILYTVEDNQGMRTVVFCPRAYGNIHSTTVTLAENTNIVGAGAFEGGCKLEKIIVNSEVTRIEKNAFSSCNEVVFEEGSKVEYLGYSAFSDYKNTSFTFPSSVKEFDGYLFFGAKLETVTLNEGLEKMGSIPFMNTKIKELVIPSTVTTINDIGACPIEKVTFAANSQLKKLPSIFSRSRTLKTLIFEEGAQLEEIGKEALKDQVNLESVILPSSLEIIGDKAFMGCTGLKDVTFYNGESNLKIIGANTFQECGLERFDVPEGVKEIQGAAFYGCELLEKINISSTTETIDNTAFENCYSLTEINVSHDNDYLSSSDGILLDKAKKELKIFPTGKARDHFALLPPSITKIGKMSFYHNRTIQNVVIPNKVTSFETLAFSGCQNLKTITLLCDEVPSEMDMGAQTSTFHDVDLKNITLYVRKELLEQYQNVDFVSYFKEILPSFLSENEKEEYIPVDDNNVDLIDVRSTNHSYVVPQNVSTNAYGETKTYNVALIGDYAFQNTPSSMKEVITFQNVEYIGAKAFKQTTTTPSIENVIFVQKEPQAQLLSTYRFELNAEDLPSSYTDEEKVQYMEIAANQNVYVRKSDCENCKTQWPKYAPQIDYKITDAPISAKYGTFAREFDVDFSDCTSEQVLAFTANLTGITSGNGDYGESEYFIQMQSINCDEEGDGTYVPKNTGVLLKYMGGVATTNAYYTIGENESNDSYTPESGYDGANVMKGITVDNTPVSFTAENPIYVMQEGLFRTVNTKYSPLTMPVHKAYLQLSNVPAGAKIIFVMDEETAIDVVDSEMNNSPVYNLQGIQVKAPQRGIYIQNGKKIMF